MGHPEDGNLASLAKYEREQDRLDAEGAALEARAAPQFIHLMKNLDSDVISEALEFLSADELRELVEDLGMTDLRDLAHAGLVMSDCVQRYVMRQAIEEVREE